jgi:hypothetical protein
MAKIRVILCSMPKLIQKKNKFHSPTDFHKCPVRFRLLHNLFYMLHLSESLLYSLALLKFSLYFFFPAAGLFFVRFFSLDPFIMAHLTTFYNNNEGSSLR